ncbi:DUF2087 domain-containing protein [Georgenia sp. MJ170]|uniref:DUF2087 domain-containing protein n=1 Tax=Georgenia sunbinii TaxID=3117728 RepID=UPI002F26946C
MTLGRGQPGWRPVVAALGNPHARRVFAQIVLGHDPEAVGRELGGARRRHALDALLGAGIVREHDGGFDVVPEAFGQVLAAGSGPRRVGPERFLDGRGQIDRLPSDATERRALLQLVAERSLAPAEVLPEAELNERLLAFSADTAGLRRAMVDDEILERTRSGSQYARGQEG